MLAFNSRRAPDGSGRSGSKPAPARCELPGYDAASAASIRLISPLSMSACKSLAPPTSTPFTNTIGNVGHPVQIFNALRRRHPDR